MLKGEVITAFLILARLDEFYKRGNKPIFCGGNLTQRIDGNPTIRAYKLYGYRKIAALLRDAGGWSMTNGSNGSGCAKD